MSIINLNTDLILLNTGYAEHHSDWNWKNLKSPIIRIHLVVKGSGIIHRNNNDYVMRENHLYLTPANITQSYKCKGDLSLFYIHIYESLESNHMLFNLLDFPIEIESDDFILGLVKKILFIYPNRALKNYDPAVYDNTHELFKNLALYKKDDIASILASKGIIHLILAKFADHAKEKFSTTDRRILELIKYIHSNLHETIYLEKLASEVYMSKDHMIRIFKKEIGVTPLEYINRKKIEKSQLLLLVSNLTIKEIAYSLGFENIPYFNQIFKKHIGISPLKYRKQ